MWPGLFLTQQIEAALAAAAEKHAKENATQDLLINLMKRLIRAEKKIAQLKAEQQQSRDT